MNPRRIAILSLGFLLITVAGVAATCSLMHATAEKRAMAFKQQLKLETWPVGRFLIDLPAGVEVEFTQGYRGAGNDVQILPCPLSKAKKLVEERVAELQGTKHREGGTLLERYVESKSLPNTWILYRWNDRTYKGNDLDIDAYHWKKASGVNLPPTKSTYLIQFGRGTDPGDTQMFQAQSELESLFQRVRIRNTREIPAEPGFCVENGFFPGEPPKGIHAESATITFSVPGHPDIWVRFNTQLVSEATAAGEKLLDRIKRVKSDPILKGLTSKELRAGDRSIGPLNGQEYLEMTKEDGLWDYQFQWEFNGVANSCEQPAIAIELTNSRAEGSKAPLSMSEEEAIVLWDAMVRSIRLRPTKPPVSGQP